MPEHAPIDDSMPQFVEAALPVPVQKLFTYRIRPGLADVARSGSRILVPFGKQTLTGFIVNLRTEIDPNSRLAEADIKDVIELLDETPLISDEIFTLTKWAAEYYAASWGEMLKASLPTGIHAATERLAAITGEGKKAAMQNRDSRAAKWRVLEFLLEHGESSDAALQKAFDKNAKRHISDLVRAGFATVHEQSVPIKVKPKLRKAVRLTEPQNETDVEKPLTDQQKKIITAMQNAGGEMLLADLLAAAKVGASPINTLAKRGYFEVIVQEVRRDPFSASVVEDPKKIKLTADQKAALSEIESGLHSDSYSAFLLHGVTGSGKTEVYIRAMQTALEGGKSSLMLVPEIALTPVFSQRLRAVFGEEVAILHSNLSAGERFDEWRRIRAGDARVVIGTRSAVFAPLENIGLIIVDEEHDTSYRQHEAPFYHARDVAVMRANKAKAAIVLGSATPALETYH
ncbi:MAG: DEAD/DEAH box helicase, partial [Pyrinomonadaceae bacterium]